MKFDPASILTSSGIAVLMILILQGYLLDKLRGEIKRHVDKDIEEFKGDVKRNVDTDIEQFKGKINKELELLRIVEDRKNLLGERYVNIVTNHRIQWTENVIDNISKLISLVRLNQHNDQLIQSFTNTAMINMVMNSDMKSKKETSNQIFNEFKTKIYSKMDIVTEISALITTLKLRLDFEDNEELIHLLSSIEQAIFSGMPSQNINPLLNELIVKAQKMLHSQWDRVKREVAAGGENM